MSAATFEADLLRGLAQLLASEGLGTWKETAGYTAAETGIVIDATPDSLSRAIQLTAYPVEDDEQFSTDVVGVQIISRWEGVNPLPSRELDSRIFDTIQGLAVTLATGVRVAYIRRTSGASLGVDASKRWARSSNYYLTVHRPTAQRL